MCSAVTLKFYMMRFKHNEINFVSHVKVSEIDQNILYDHYETFQ